MAKLTCWIIDTRSLWPGDRIQEAAPEHLDLLSPSERQDVCRKLFMRDARMSLASALLKRLYVSRTLGVPWAEIAFTRFGDAVHGKPGYAGPAGGAQPALEFNVSHQAGLVVLVGCEDARVRLGVDVVCVNERNDMQRLEREGFERWVDTYAEVFSEREVREMKYGADPFPLLDGVEVGPRELGEQVKCCATNEELEVTLANGQTRTFGSELLVEAKLRRFYAYWCYKEAYIKLVGEGLLAEWLKEVEFRNVRAPRPGTVARCSTHGSWGEVVDDAEVWLRGERLGDVQLQLQGFEEQYMIGVAGSPRDGFDGFPGFETVTLDEVLAYARESMGKADLAVGR